MDGAVQLELLKQLVAVVFVVCLTGCSEAIPKGKQKNFPVPHIDLDPHKYMIYKCDQPIQIDGKLDEDSWKKAQWTNYFVDIEGIASEDPEHLTRAKLLWDKNYLYIGAELKEKDVWATMTKRNSPLFRDNAFEIFIDPDGDTHNYLEFEINALSTIWDILLTKPGRDGGHSYSQYNILDLKADVYVDGKINDPDIKDSKWTLEVAFPLHALRELSSHRRPPKGGDQWRIQLARAQRQLEVVNGKYQIKKDPGTKREIQPNYWSWSPQGLVNLHYPEMWGFVQFSEEIVGRGTDEFVWDRDEEIKWALRKIYYRLREYHLNHDSYTDDFSKLGMDKISVAGFNFSPVIKTTETMFEVSSTGFDKETIWYINQNGKVWSE